MAIAGIIYDNQVPTAKGLRGAFKSALTDGIIAGCPITTSGQTITIGAGLINVSGGIFQVSGSETVTLSKTSGFARIKAVADMSKASTTSSFKQVYFTADYATTATGFTALTQNDINVGDGTKYEAEIAVIKITSSSSTSVVRTATASAKIAYGDALPSDAPEGTVFLLKV